MRMDQVLAGGTRSCMFLSEKLSRRPCVARFQVNPSHLVVGAQLNLPLDLARFRLTTTLLSEEIWQKLRQLPARLAVALDWDLLMSQKPKRFHC